MSFHFRKSTKPLTAGELLRDATNVYRTKDYIVKQRISISNLADGNTVMVSDDVYFLRTSARDNLYEKIFSSLRRNVNGKRIKTALHTRQYVE